MRKKSDIEWLLNYHMKEDKELEQRLKNNEITFDEYEVSHLLHKGNISACKFILQID
ncbi:MAG: hypothetical protein PUC30_12225 [Lachnospiraceae bacterium]|nr:hypothetical protein [Lachnospiraceae bacterium]